MRVEELNINRGYYENKPLQGSITFKDANSAEIKVPLSPAAISRLLAAISTEVNSTIRTVASEAPKAMKYAEEEGYLLEHNGEI
jgi:hypothetical protein